MRLGYGREHAKLSRLEPGQAPHTGACFVSTPVPRRATGGARMHPKTNCDLTARHPPQIPNR